MKKSKQYQKGKHIYIKSGKNKEVHTIQEKKQEFEFDDNYEEIYADCFKFETSKEGFKLFFGKKLFGTNQIKLKRVIKLGYKNCCRLLQLLKNTIEIYNKNN